MKPEFNECNFMLCMISEFQSKNKFNSKNLIPITPSQFEEKKLGYDLTFNKGIPVFFQFKVPDYLFTKHAKEWTYFNSSYYRFKIYDNKISPQHNNLVKLGKNKFNNVFYVSPLFHTFEDFENFLLDKKIVENTKFIKTRSLKTIKDGEEHCICYKRNSTIMFSEPQVLKESEYTIGCTFEQINDAERYTLEELIKNLNSLFRDDLQDKNINVVDYLYMHNIVLAMLID